MNMMSRDAVEPATGSLSLMVRQVRYEAVGINSYEFVHPDGQELPEADAGSHVDIQLPGGLVRQYSLCNDPADRRRYVIAVLKEAQGRGGSRLLHEIMQVQNIVSVSQPRNNFRLSPQAPHSILIGGGIGITPLKAMAHRLAATGASFELHYCAKAPEFAAFREDLAELGSLAKIEFHYDGGDPSQGLDLRTLLADHREATHLYYCGPGGFMAACSAASAHWPAGTVHSEHFKAPASEPVTGSDEAASGSVDNFIVQIASSGLELDIPEDRSIVEVLHEAGIAVDTSCVSGLCGSCKVHYLAGEVEHRDFILSDEERSEYLTTCVSRALSRKLVLDL